MSATPETGFAELVAATNYSFLRGASHPADMVAEALALGMTGIGIAGIPSASLVGVAVILGAVGLPLEGIGLVLAVDRILDMCRTTVNVFGDSCAAVVVGRLGGEDGILGEPALKR